MKLNSKVKEILLSIWKDPVWSKMISAGILALIAVAWAKLSHKSWLDIYHSIVTFLSCPRKSAIRFHFFWFLPS